MSWSLRLQGEFTGETLKSLEDDIDQCHCLQRFPDCAGYEQSVFMDSQALEYLVDLSEQCRENTRQLKIAGLDENCTKILELTRLLPQFDTYTELTEAVKSFA